MENNVDHVSLERLLSMTQLMLQKAQNGEWEEVLALEKERDRQIKVIAFVDSSSTVIRQLLAMDKNITELATLHKQDLAAQLKQLNKGKNAIHAYL